MNRQVEATLIAVLGLVAINCGPKHRGPAVNDPFADILEIGSRSMTLRYFKGTTTKEDLAPTLPSQFSNEHRHLMKMSITHQLTAFEDEIMELRVLPVTHIWVESAWAPCGIPNGGACYTPQLVWATGGDAYHIPYYFHELFHHYRWLVDGNVDPEHNHAAWRQIYVRQEQLNAQIRAQHLGPQLLETNVAPRRAPELAPVCGCAK
jgi:hypothetical protein